MVDNSKQLEVAENAIETYLVGRMSTAKLEEILSKSFSACTFGSSQREFRFVMCEPDSGSAPFGMRVFPPEHPFYSDFSTLQSLTAGRATCRQTIPSPANLYLEILTAHESVASYKYPSHQTLAEDIAEAYRQTIMQFYSLGCRSLQLDDTALGRMTDISFIETLIKGGIDPTQLLGLLTDIINKSIAGLPEDMETSIYISAGEPIVPHWKMVSGANHVMPDILARLQTKVFFLPFTPGDHDSLRILDHIPAGKRVVLGLITAHTPFPDNLAQITDSVICAASHIPAQMLSISPVSGFKLSSFISRGLSYEDQWSKIESMARIANVINP